MCRTSFAGWGCGAGRRRLWKECVGATAAERLQGGHSGSRLSFGGNEGGYGFYLQNGHLHYAQNVVSAALLEVRSVEPVPAGRHSLRFAFEPTGPADIKAGKGVPGRGQLYVDGHPVGQADFAATVPITYGLGGGVVCGADPGSPVTPATCHRLPSRAPWRR